MLFANAAGKWNAKIVMSRENRPPTIYANWNNVKVSKYTLHTAVSYAELKAATARHTILPLVER